MQAMNERRHIHTERITALHKLARSTDDAERRVAARLLQQIDAELRARDETAAQRQEAA
ncbi:MAG TPA: hypothetical protein VFW94_02970 [Candidatus Acidoferrales bacterium]|nr:hypothetical protein [Candidatus Acidoferrales bacterium]